MSILKRIIKWVIKLGLIGFITLVLFEVCYRYHIVDFYASEINGLNEKSDLQKYQADVLVFGDSFSATSKAINYVDRLRETYSEKTFLNFSIPGTGVRQLNTFAKQKIERYKPETIIYQIYAGNDLLDVEKFKVFNNVSLGKYAFWQVSNSFLSLPYLNHKSSVFKPKVNYRTKTIKIKTFREDYYNKRSKNYLSINPNYLEETINLSGNFDEKYDLWLEEINAFLSVVPDTTKVCFVWVPHCTQVNAWYLNNFKSLNANFLNEANYLGRNYSFFNRANNDLKHHKNVSQLNLLEAFKKADTKSTRVYFANDPHLNKYGNDVLAKELKTSLRF